MLVTIGIRRFVIDDEDCETLCYLCESYVTHTRVCEKKPKSAFLPKTRSRETKTAST